MLPCISQATTMSTPFEADLEAYARGGFQLVELWLTKLETYLETHSIDDVRKILVECQLKAVAAASQGGLLSLHAAERKLHSEQFQSRLETLERLGVGVVIVTGDFHQTPRESDLATIVTALGEAGELARNRGVRVALEFQKSARFLSSLDTAVALAAQCGSDNVGICLDMFHYYCGPSKRDDLGYLSLENLAWVQASDLIGVPRELATDSDRILPGEGSIEIDAIVDYLARIGYAGPISLEAPNPMLWAIAAERVADVGFQAIRRILPGSRSNATGAPGARGGF